MAADDGRSGRLDELPLTHEFISYMVGGPRSAVTEAAAELRESGAIAYRRGLITISSPEKLREQSCECYELLGDPTDDARRIGEPREPRGRGLTSRKIAASTLLT